MQPIHSFPVYIIIVDNNSEYFTFFIFSEENHLCKSKTSIKSFKTCLGVLCRRRSKISCLVAVNKSCAYDLQAKSRSMVRVWLNNVWLIVRSACASERTALIILSLLWVICQPCGELRLFGYFISVGCWINWSEQAGYTAEQVSFLASRWNLDGKSVFVIRN